MEVVTIFDSVQPRLAMGDVTVPMKRHNNDTILCSVCLELDNSTNTAMRAESADLWHRRLGHINSRSLDVLRKVEGKGIDYIGNVKACDVCAIGKSAQQAHPKKATYDIKKSFQLELADLMGSMSPPALGGFQYVSKFVNQQTKWKEMFLIKAKSDAIETIKLFNQSLVIPTGLRLECLRGDRSTEYTARAFREYCLQIGVKLEFASTNTPQQTRANELAGQTLAAKVRCLLTGLRLPNFLWGELMQTAVYLSNRVPHTALGNITPYKALYGKDADLGQLRAIEARTSVRVESHTRTLDPKSWEGRLCGYSMDSKLFRIYNPAKGNVRESRNLIFIKTPPTLPDSAPTSGLTDGEFTYDDNDDLLRDVMDYTSCLDLDSPADHGTIAPSALDTAEMRQLVNNIREITGRNLLVSTTSPAPPEEGSHREVSSSRCGFTRHWGRTCNCACTCSCRWTYQTFHEIHNHGRRTIFDQPTCSQHQREGQNRQRAQAPSPLHQIPPGGYGTMRGKAQHPGVRLRHQQRTDAQSFGGGKGQDHTKHLQGGHKVAGSQHVESCI